MPEPIEIRLLTMEDAEAFVSIRREALETEPLAFASSLSDEFGLDLQHMRKSLSEPHKGSVFGAFSPDLIGIVGLYRYPYSKSAHKAGIWGMFVRSGFRHRGVAGLLLNAVIQCAREMPGIIQIHLSVSETAQTARRLYEKNGFKIWGSEPRALHYSGLYIAEDHMALEI